MITALLSVPALRLQNGVARKHKPTFSAPVRPTEKNSAPTTPVGERIGNAMQFSVGNGHIQKINLAHLSPPVQRLNSLDESALLLVQDFMPSARLKNRAEQARIANELAVTITSQLKKWLEHPQKYPLWQIDLNQLLNQELNRQLFPKGPQVRITVETDFHAPSQLQSQFRPALKSVRLYQALSYNRLADGRHCAFGERISPIKLMAPVFYLGHMGLFLPRLPQTSSDARQLKQQLQEQLEALLRHIAGETPAAGEYPVNPGHSPASAACLLENSGGRHGNKATIFAV